jgi:hypothetical protein
MNWSSHITYTVFISSTFADMQSERDYLNLIVFPEIQSLLNKRNISLRIIDLRSGINTQNISEEDLEKKILKVCFNEIKRSYPLFIGLLGNRYGWIPESEYYHSYFKNKIFDYTPSITALEIEYALSEYDSLKGCFFFERNNDCYRNMNSEQRKKYDDSFQNDEISIKNSASNLSLKNQIKNKLKTHHLTENYSIYSSKWNNEKFTELENFGKHVKEKLLGYIEEHSNTTIAINDIEKDHLDQQQFISHKLNGTYQRETILNKLIIEIEKPNHGIILEGESGTGKSCIYACLVNYFTNKDDYLVLYHSANVNHFSMKAQNMLNKWCLELEDIFNISHKKITNVNLLIKHFHRLLKKSNKEIVILIDSLDSFQENEIIKYLTFYPRFELANVKLFASSLPNRNDHAIAYNKKLNNISLEQISNYEAKQIINAYSKYQRKEFYEQNIKEILAINSNTTPACSNPLWLNLAITTLMALTQEDYEHISKQKLSNHDHQIINYTNSLIQQFPIDSKDLFVFFLDRLENYYNSFPKKLFSYLSASYCGLSEQTLQLLFEDYWNARTFAIIKNYLNFFLTETGSEKTWKISHQKLHLNLSQTEISDISNKISSIYLNKNNEIPLNDNISFYLFHSNNYEKALQLLLRKRLSKSRFYDECIQLIDVIGLESLLRFLKKIFILKKNKNRIKKSISRSLFRQTIYHLSDYYQHIGDFHTSYKIMNWYLVIFNKFHMIKDLKIILFLMTHNKLLTILKNLNNDQKLLQEYENGYQKIKIKGLISFLFARYVKRYYRWNIFKLKNNLS